MSELSAVRAEELASLAVFAGVPPAQLTDLAAHLEPLNAPRGRVLMRQGDRALSFLIIASGEVEVLHTDSDGVTVLAALSEGLIVGEIALLRNAPRSATVTAATELYGYVGYEPAFYRLLEIPDIQEKLVATARRRLAAFITPIPVRTDDGAELFLRPVLPGDSQRVVHGQVKFSAETLYRRFLSVGTPNETLLAYLFEVDYVDHFVWVLTDGIDGPVVADARFVRDEDDPTVAEIAFTVADAYQGRGIGTLLFAALVVAARADGINRFHARVLADNAPSRALLDQLGAAWEREEPGIVAATLDVPASKDLAVKLPALEQISDVARRVIEAFD
ncbi:MAG: GNAT family N-acetyltransferase [Mycolicibacterium sp.]|nr:GNAT family N-acetyltransferase [Mycolicibacterium sp.]